MLWWFVKGNRTFFQNKMVSYVNVFRPRMLHKILGNINSIGIVTVQHHSLTIKPIVIQHLSHPKELSAATASSHVFSFNGGERN